MHKMSHTSFGHWRMLCALSILGVAGCAAETSPEDSPVESRQLLAAYPSAPLWDQNGNVVNMCWTTSGMGTLKNAVRDAVNAAWGANSGLTFTWPANAETDTCPHDNSGNVPSTYMPLFLERADGWWGHCQPGYGARMSAKEYCGDVGVTCQCSFASADTDAYQIANVTATAVHEIGHGLGLPHEHTRADRPSDIETTCAALDSNLAQHPEWWTTNGNYTMDPSLLLLTRCDTAKSIMSYCRDRNDDGRQDNPMSPELSQWDALGIEMLYPKQFGRTPVVYGGIADGNGSQYVVRSDVTVQFALDWQERGALPNTLNDARWSGPSGIFSTALNPSLVVSSSGWYEVEVDDVLDRHHPWTGINVVADNALHTAITVVSPTLVAL